MRYSNIPLLISIGENLVFNNLSLGLNSISQKTECVRGAGQGAFCVVVALLLLFWWSHEVCGVLVPQPDIEPQPRD